MDDYSDAPSPSDRTPYTDSETRYPELHGTSEAGMNEDMNMNDADTHGDTHFDPASHLGDAADFRHAHNLVPEIIRSGNIRPSSDMAPGIHINPWPVDPSLQPQRQPQPDAAEVRPPALYTGEPGGGLDYTISPYELAHIENTNAGYMDSTQRTFGESSADAMTKRSMQRREGDEW
ncbi:hypothetical protein BS50DRAFT_577335 [Corynespora cassiicola Philippines]|uniref:Uncharacterized protein n=1 Tax=Corynespora cassiicola Philippines TaxID=1448308 RepID=A0A2T2NAH7_CORCC|nr:hypothetical protein BS50DRAFT_577335 [Corynespora cassiicola Philippines]